MNTLGQYFNSREQAVIVWFIIGLIWCFKKSAVRKGLVDVLRVFFQIKIVIPIVLMILYVIAFTKLYEIIGFWHFGLLKSTILWTLGSALVMLVNSPEASRGNGYFKKIFFDSIKMVIVIEFLANFHAFHFIIELIILPVVTILIGMQTLAEYKEEYKPAENLINWILGIFGMVVFYLSIRSILSDFDSFASVSNLRDFILPLLYSISLLPFLYLLALYIVYEQFFIRLNFSNEGSELLGYAKRRIILKFHLNMNKLNKWTKESGYKVLHSKEDIKRALSMVGEDKQN